MDLRKLNMMVWFLALVVTLDGQSFACTNVSSKPAGAPMPVISDTYQAHVEVSILDKNYTMALDEYLDYKGNRAVLVIHKAGHTENMIFSYDTNEVFDINDQNCKVYTVDNNPYTFLFGSNVSATSDKRHIFGTVASLRLAAANNAYNGTGNVRGIPADIWSACLAWPGASGNIKATFYFSKVGWNTSSPELQIPLRVEVEGLSTTLPSNKGPEITTSGPIRHFHHVYDFIGYLPYIDADPAIFLTPPEVICLNRKNEKELPTFATHFKYKAEVVDSPDSQITHYAIWYDENYKMVREDTRQIVTPPGGGASILNTTTEIHDFNTGVRYIMDHLGGCSIRPINPSVADNSGDVARFQFNGSLVVDIRDPNSFFVFNSNYTYIGQRTIRGITCDVFSAIIPGYQLQDASVSAVYEYAFLADGWSDIPLYATGTNVQNYPVQLVISVSSRDYTRVYNFFDFAEDPVTYPTYDISVCFDEKHKLGFQITFPGDFGVGLQEEWTAKIYDVLVKTMQVFPIRVGGIAITNDDDNVYVNAYVLASSSSAQFEKINISLEHEDDALIKGITMSDECASLCVTNTDFTCEGFQYCPDDGFACRLSKNHVPTFNVTKNATACDEFARTVKIATMKEPLLKDAYNSLESAVNQQNLQVIITDSQGNVLPPFTALNVDLVSGDVVQNKPLPSLPRAFSYRLEIAVPSSSSVQEMYIWYDQDKSLVRTDKRDPSNNTPYMVTTIHDFNLGVAYKINQVTEECTVGPITSSEVFDVTTQTLSTARNGGLVVTMKSPNGLFFLDDTYSYVGQSTARGILCDVFESKRGDFDLEYNNTSTGNTVFKYYFQTSSWTYTAPQSSTSTLNQPVQLNIEDKSIGAFVTYNFFDFTEQHFPASFFDASACYTSEEKKSFLIAFKNQPFHPVLDKLSNVFLDSALDLMAGFTFTSVINFQHASLTYDDDDIYLIVTALGHTSMLNLFSPVMKVDHNTTVSQVNALSNSDCAAACVSTNSFICNSFDYCQDTSTPNCILGIRHAEDEGDPLDSAGPCVHYSRSENGTFPNTTGMSVQKLYDTISNYVYHNKFVITVTLQNGTKVPYVGTDIRDDILRPTDPDSTPESSLRKFVITPGYQFNQSLIAVVHTSVSVIDCAIACIQENTFVCQAFDYHFTLGTCRLSNIHPDELNKTSPGITLNEFTSIYARFYTADYTQYDAQVFGTHADKTILSVKSDELCARACTDNKDFVCEAFEICIDGSCLLRKTHILEASPNDATQTPNCVHYSRNHLFDFIRRDNRIIQGHDDSSLQVNDASVCAQLCGTGDGLPNCASFELCQQQQAVTLCTLSTADPTTQKDLIIVDSMQCSLFTRANPNSNGMNPTVNPTRTGPSVRPTSGGAVSTVSPKGTGISVKPTDAAVCAAQSGSSSDTGARVGIAFGTLILGLLLGAGCTFMYMRYRFGRHGDQEGGTVLKTWDS